MAKVNIYVKNIPNKASEQDILDFLGRFGKIVSHKFFREKSQMDLDPNGVSGFGYVQL